MFELLFCSFFTILPDYLFRRFRQGKRIGHEITFFSVWYELRWGLTGCLMLTILLITTVFYFHPSTSTVTSFFRTVTILPQIPGRVSEVYVSDRDRVAAGDPIFRIDDATQRTALEAARLRISEVDAAVAVAGQQLISAQGSVDQAIGTLEQAEDELARQLNLQARNADVVAGREIDRLQNLVEARQGGVDAAAANLQAIQTQIDVLFPAQRASAEAALAQAQAELDKTLVVASFDGMVEQFQLQEGDFVSSILRPAGIIVPDTFEEGRFVAGFGQLTGQIIRPGMLAEISCASLPFTVVPMVVTGVQPVIAAGQFRPSDLIRDVGQMGAPGTITVNLEALFPGQTDAIPPGSACVANAYTSFHDRLNDPDLSTLTWLGMHAVDTVGLIHAIILRAQTLLLPVRSLVLSGGH